MKCKMQKYYKEILRFKSFYIFYVFLFFYSNVLKAQVDSLSDKDFKLDVSFYPLNNNFAKSGIKIKDGYIISGQNFFKKDTITNNSAVIKLSNEGVKLKELFSGNDVSYRNPSTNKIIYGIDNNRLIQIGEKNKKKLWLRVLNTDLEILKDTVYKSIPIDVLSEPYFFEEKNGFYIVSNSSYYRDLEINITYFDKKTLKGKNDVIKFIEEPFNFFKLGGFTATHDVENNLMYILLNGCPEREKNLCKEYKLYLIEYDLFNKKINNFKIIEEPNFNDARIIFHKNDLYLIGIKRLKEKLENNQTKNITKFNVKVYSTGFDKKREFEYGDDTFNQYMNHAIILNDKIYIGGYQYNNKIIKEESLFLTFDLEGKLLEKLLFSDEKKHSENRITKIVPLENDTFLLLGKGNGWRIIVK